MKYSYRLIVFIVLILYQVLLIFGLDQQSSEQYDGFKSEHKSLSRNKRQIFKGSNSFKRNDYGYNENDDELDESSLSANNGNNQKKSKFVAWGGKRSDSTDQKQQNGQHNNLNTYVPLAAKRFRSWGGKRSEKPFRTWGGKRSSGSDGENLEFNLKLNDYLKRLEALNFLINEIDGQNYD